MRNRGWLIRSALALAALVVFSGMSDVYGASRGDQIPPETYIMGGGNKDYEPYFDDNFNGVYDPGEPFVDTNRNGLWDLNVFVGEGGVVTSKRVMFCYTAVDNSITDGLERDNNLGRMQFSYFDPFTSRWSEFTNETSCVLEVPESVISAPVPNYDLSYTFKVRAKDPSGNIDPEPAMREFYVGAGYLGTITSVGGETIVDKSAAWSDQSLVGLYLNPNIEQTQTFLIVGNTLNKIYVEEGSQLEAISQAGDRFWVVYPMLNPPNLSVFDIATRGALDRLVVGTGNRVVLTWSQVSSGYQAQVRYNVYRNGVIIGTDFASTTFTDPDSADPGTQPPLNGTTYTYEVEAKIITPIMTYTTTPSNPVKAAPIDLTMNSSDMLEVSPGEVTLGRDTNEIVYTLENITKTKPIKWSVYLDTFLRLPNMIRYGQYLWAGRFTGSRVTFKEGGGVGDKAEVRLLDTTASWEPGSLVGLEITIAERFLDTNGNGRFEWSDCPDEAGEYNGRWDYGEGERDASGQGQTSPAPTRCHPGFLESDEFIITSNNRTSLTVDRDPTRIGRNDDGQVINSSGAGSYYYIRDWQAVSALSLSKVTGEVLMEPDTFTLTLDRDKLPSGWYILYLYVEQNGRDPYRDNDNPLDAIVCRITIQNGNPLSISRAIGIPYEAPLWGIDAGPSTLGVDQDTVTLAHSVSDGETDFDRNFMPTHKSFAYWGPTGTQASNFGEMFIGAFLNPDVSDLAQWVRDLGSATEDRPPQCYRIESYSVQSGIGSTEPAYTQVTLELPASSNGHIGVDRRDYPPPYSFPDLGITAGIDYTVYRPWGDGSANPPMSDTGAFTQCYGWGGDSDNPNAPNGYQPLHSRTRGQWTVGDDRGADEVMIRLNDTSLARDDSGNFIMGIDTEIVATAKGDYNDVLNYWWRPALVNETTDFSEGTRTGSIHDYDLKPETELDGSVKEVGWKACDAVIVTGSAEGEATGGLREECYVTFDSAFAGSAIVLDPIGGLGPAGGGGHYFITQAYNPEPYYDEDWVDSWKRFLSGATPLQPNPPLFFGGGGGSDCLCDATGSLNAGSPFKDLNHNCTYDGLPTLTFWSTDITNQGSAQFNSFVIYDSDGDNSVEGMPRRWCVSPSRHTILEPRLPGDTTGRNACNNPDAWTGGMALGNYPMLVNGDGELFWDNNGNGVYDAPINQARTAWDVLYEDPLPNDREPNSWRSNYLADDLDSQDLYCVIEPGETVTGYLNLTNKSVTHVLSVSALIAEFDPYVTLVSNNLTMWDNVRSGMTVTALPQGSGVGFGDLDRYAFRFTVSEQLPCYASGYNMTFYTKVFDSWGGVSYDDSFRVKLFRADPPKVVPPTIDDDRYGYSGTSPRSNGDGVVQAGERVELLVRLKNEGCVPIGNSATQLVATLSVDHPLVTLQAPSPGLFPNQRQYWYILPGDEAEPYAVDPEFELEVDDTYDGSPIPFEITVTGPVTYGSAPPVADEYLEPCDYSWRTSFCENPKIYGIVHYNKLSGNSTALLTSVLIDDEALFVPGSLTGLMLNPNTRQSKTFRIISNSTTHINVNGDIRTVATVGDPYEVVRDSSNIVLAPGETVEVVMTGAPGQIATFNFEKVTRERVSGSISGVSGSRLTDFAANFKVGSLVGLRLRVTGLAGATIFNVVGNSKTVIVLDRDATGVSMGDQYETFGAASHTRFFESNIRMYDDGQHKDGAAGDGVYVGDYTVRENDDALAEVVGYLEDVNTGNVGHVYASKPLMIDIGPPAPPENVIATVGAIQIAPAARLEWDPNTEFDFLYCRDAGYAIFRSEDPSEVPRDPIDILTWATATAGTSSFYVGPPEAFTDANGNGEWDAGESFRDWNANGIYDSGPYYLDGTAANGVTYYYYIKAFDAYGNSSDYSTVVGFTLYSQLGMGVDNMPDSWEQRHGLKTPMGMDTYNDDLDFDNDGLTNLEEFLLHTNPTDPDTDKDGECDGSEYDRTNVLVSPIDPSDESLVFNLRPGGYAGISTGAQTISNTRFTFIDSYADWLEHQFQGAVLYAGNNTRFDIIDNTETSLVVSGTPAQQTFVIPDYYWIDGSKHVRPDTDIEAVVSSVYGIDPRSITMYIDGTEVPNEDLEMSPCYAMAYGDFARDELAECWVVDTYNDRVLELGGSTMREIASIEGAGFNRPEGFALDPTTRTLWIADTGNNEVVKLKLLSSLSGTWTSAMPDMTGGMILTDDAADWTPGALVGYTVYPNTGQFVMVGFTITSNTRTQLTIDETYPVGAGNSYVINYYETEEQCRIVGFNNPTAVAVDWIRGHCWVSDTGNDRVIRLESDIESYGAVYDLDVCFGYHTSMGGTQGADSPLSMPKGLTVNSYPYPVENQGVCWVADSGNGDVVQISPGGTAILKRIHGFSEPTTVALTHYPAAIWVADSGNDRVVKLDGDVPDGYDVNASNYPERDAKVLLEPESYPTGVAVNQVTGEAWAALSGTGQLVHVAEDGELLATINGFVSPVSVGVSSYRNLANETGVCWVADTAADMVYKVDPDIPDGYNLLSDTGYLSSTATGAVIMPSFVEVNSGGVQAGYRVKHTPAQPFGFGQVVEVVIESSDLYSKGRSDGSSDHGSSSFDFTTVQRDTSAPFLENQAPPNRSHNALVNTVIAFDVLDVGTGINGDTLELRVNDELIFQGVSDVGPYATVEATQNSDENASGYSVVYEPPVSFEYNSLVTVEVVAADFAFPEANQSRLTFSFTTEIDRDPPMVYEGSEQPAAGQTGVNIDTQVVGVVIFDTKSGVDPNTVEVAIDDEPVAWSQLVFEDWAGLSGYRGYRVYAPIGKILEYNETVVVCIRAADFGGDEFTGANWMDAHCWQFTIGADLNEPYFLNLQPHQGESRVRPNVDIVFDVLDDEEGVDMTSITMLLDDVQVDQLQVVPISRGFTVTYNPPTNFNPNTIVDVELSAVDLASPPNSGSETYRFTLQDLDPPLYDATSATPRDGSTEVAIDTMVLIRITDLPRPDEGVEFNSGIDESSVRLMVNGTRVSHQLSWIYAPYSAYVKYQGGFSYCRTIDVSVSCADLEGNAMEQANWSFTTTGCYSKISVPDSITFDKTAKEGTPGTQPSVKTLTISNEGWQDLTVTDLEITKGSTHFYFPMPPLLPITVDPQGSKQLSIACLPKRYGDVEGEVKITPAREGEDDPNPPAVYTHLYGEAGYAPVVKIGSLEYSDVSSERGGPLQVLAMVGDPEGTTDIARVVASLNGELLGELHDDGLNGDWAAGDGTYFYGHTFAPREVSGDYLVTIEAIDRLGYHSVPWPYVRVEQYNQFYANTPFDSYQPAVNTCEPNLLIARCYSDRAETMSVSPGEAGDNSGGSRGPGATRAAGEFRRPVILGAGFGDWNYTFLHTQGGKIMAYARVQDYAGSPTHKAIDTVELMLPGGQRIGNGWFLTDDWASGVDGDLAGDGGYVLIVDNLKIELTEGDYILEMVATDIYGNESLVWPYFHVE